jgi:undecaprenyl-diphosphatase
MRFGLPSGLARRLNPLERYGVRLTLFGLALALVGIPFGLLLHQVVSEGPLTGLDTRGAAELNRFVHDRPNLVKFVEAVSFLGKPIWLTVVIGVPAAWLLVRGQRKLVVFLVATSIGGGVVDTLVKLAVGRPRPEVDEPVATAFGKSFPSGHSMSSTICYGALLLVFLPLLAGLWKRIAIGGAAALVVAIGTSRLALGVHYISDVLGGFVLGAAWLVASVAAFEIWRVERGRRRTHPLAEGVEPEEARQLTSH